MPDPNAKHGQGTPANQQVVDLTDPRQLMAILGNMFQNQAESNEINRKLLQIKEREEEARLAKDADAKAKWERARKAALQELEGKLVNDKKRWAGCPHAYRGGSTIWPISSYPDGRLRGICSQCFMPIEPEHYEFDALGNVTRVPQHPLYEKVLERDMQIYQPFLPVMSY